MVNTRDHTYVSGDSPASLGWSLMLKYFQR